MGGKGDAVKLCPHSIISGALIGLMSFICLSCAMMEPTPKAGPSRRRAFELPVVPAKLAPYKVRVINELRGGHI